MMIGEFEHSHYREVISEWDWIQKYPEGKTSTPNAVNWRNCTYNILFNERFSNQDIEDIVLSICI